MSHDQKGQPRLVILRTIVIALPSGAATKENAQESAQHRSAQELHRNAQELQSNA